MRETLDLTCSAFPQDTLHLEVLDGEIVADFNVHDPDGYGRGSIRLDEENVRQLFNWLGVWLHKN